MRILLACLLVFVAACSGDDGPTGPRVVLETRVVDAATLAAGVDAAEQVVGARNASQSPAQLADLGRIPSAEAGPIDLYQVVGGTQTTMDFDIDDDGSPESLDIFRTNSGLALLAWRDGESCHLAYDLDGDAWYFDGVCGVDSSVVCRFGGEAACQLCDAENCAQCETDAADTRAISCFEIVEPEPEPQPDVGVDATPDVDDDADSEDTDTTDAETPDVEFDVTEDTGPTPGSCDPVCLSNGGTCCLSCGCSADDCTPVCPDGFSWDCEQGCCFDFETFECAA